MWLWMKYVTGVNDEKHCTNCLRGKYGKILSKHNTELEFTPMLTLNEQPLDSFSAIYICGVIKKCYPRSNYEHNLHTAIIPTAGRTDTFEFENWRLTVTNGLFEPIPSEVELPVSYRGLPPQFTTCRIFRWAVCSDLNRTNVSMET
ncbi:hypothetical protein Q31a_29580 [Aureliella helgolandensis]|uniref:Uncharacterized protein n=2 Tax=Aureliella helgolandensis TaxID=2527968 RepID=A0A518G7S5_9BACT|nr:hypothetical protein Q31a_29580 [Aureliella helgolandensis]